MTTDPKAAKPKSGTPILRYDMDELRRAVGAADDLRRAVGKVNPRPPGWHNGLIQLFKRLMARLLAWLTRPVNEFNASVSQSLSGIVSAVDNLQTNLSAIDVRLTQLEQESALRQERLQRQIELLQSQVKSSFNMHETTSLETPASQMETDWDKRAREDARYFIDTGHSESEEAFEKSGEWDLTNHILQGLTLSSRATVLEIGCGIGRLLKPLARRVANVIGVDISSEMVQKARSRLAEFANVRIHKTGGDLSFVDASSVDYCFSFVVFQHIPDKELIFDYFKETSRILREGGIFRFQINQRPEKFMESHLAGTWDGVGLEHVEVVAYLEKAGFKILDTWGEMTHYAWYTAEKVKKAGSKEPETLTQFHPTPVDPAEVGRFFQRIGEELTETKLNDLLSRRLAWRVALDFLIEKWSSLTDEEFIRHTHRALLNREIEHEALRPNLSMMNDGKLTRSVFLDCLVSSKEFRDVLAGEKG